MAAYQNPNLQPQSIGVYMKQKHKYNITHSLNLFVLVICLLMTAGCVKRDKSDKINNEKLTTEAETTTEANVRYNTQDTVILTAIDTEKSQLSVRGVGNKGKVYILNYTGGTSIKNKYGSEILISQLEIGDIFDVYYMAGTQKLIAIEASSDIWENDYVTAWDLDYDLKLMTIGGEKYQYDDATYIYSGKKAIDIRSISGVDTLIVRGKEKQIYSIVVKTGHGYIKLTDTANMIGGMVDVGGKIMTVITEDMVIVAPEGEYTLWAAKDGKGGTTTVKVNRDDEVTVSLSGFQGQIEKNGALKLTVLPAGVSCNVFIDGRESDISDIVDLSYGTHKLYITSDGYTDYTETITISSIYTNKTVDLSNPEGTTGSSSAETTEGSTEQTTTNSSAETDTTASKTGNNQLTISKPEGASVYIDGVFKGTIPLTITKESGEHTILLRQTGYKSVVYNVEFSDDESDVNISLPEMEENE